MTFNRMEVKPGHGEATYRDQSRTELEKILRPMAGHEAMNRFVVSGDQEELLAAIRAKHRFTGKHRAAVAAAAKSMAELSAGVGIEEDMEAAQQRLGGEIEAARAAGRLMARLRPDRPKRPRVAPASAVAEAGGGVESGVVSEPPAEIIAWEAVPDPVVELTPKKVRQPRKRVTLAQRLSEFPPDGQKLVSRATFSEGGPEFTFIRTEGYAFVRVHQTGADTWEFRIPNVAAQVPHGRAQSFDYTLGNTRTLEAALRHLSSHLLNDKHRLSEEAIIEAARGPEIKEKVIPQRTVPDAPRRIDHAEVTRRVEQPAEIARQIEWLAYNLQSSRYPVGETVARAREDVEFAEDGDGDAWDDLEKTRRRLASEYFWQVEHISPADELERTELILDELNRRNVPGYSVMEVGALKEELEKAKRATADDSTGEKRKEFYTKISPTLSAYRAHLTQRRNDGERIPSEEHVREREAIRGELRTLLDTLVPNSAREVAMSRDNVPVVRALIALDSGNQRDTADFARALWMFGELSHRINNAVVDDSEIGQRTLKREWERLGPKLKEIVRKRDIKARNARIENRHQL